MEHIIKTIAPASSGLIAWEKSSIKCASAMGGHVNPHFISHSLHDPGHFFTGLFHLSSKGLSLVHNNLGRSNCVQSLGRSKQRRLGPESFTFFNLKTPTPRGRRVTPGQCQHPKGREHPHPATPTSSDISQGQAKRLPVEQSVCKSIFNKRGRAQRVWLQARRHVPLKGAFFEEVNRYNNW